MKRKIFHTMTPLPVMEAFIEKQAEKGYELISVQKTFLDISYYMTFVCAEKKTVTVRLQEIENGLLWIYKDGQEIEKQQKANIDKGLVLFLKMNVIVTVMVLLLWLLLCMAVYVKVPYIRWRMGTIFVISMAMFYLILKALRTPLMVKTKSDNKETFFATLVTSVCATAVFEIVYQIIVLF